MASPVIPAALAPAFRGYNSTFNAAFVAQTPLWSKFAMKTPSTGESETYGWLEESPGVREWIGSRIRHTEKLRSFTITNKDWEVTEEISGNAVEDDKLSMFGPRIVRQAATAAMKPDLLVLNLLVDSFVGLAYDSAAFFGTHTWKNTTWDNSTTASLDADSFAAAKEEFIKTLGSFGAKDEAPLNMNPQFMLVVGPSLEATARTILNAQLIGGGDSNINLNAAELLVLPYLNNNTGAAGTVQAANYWFLICTNSPGGLMPFIYQERRPWRTQEFNSSQDWIVFDTNTFVWGADARFNVGRGLWQLAYGSTGTNE